jgi:5'-3' exonuclease
VQIHLVDGTFELFRAFFGAPAARAPDGREVGAVRGLVRSLHALCREPGVTHVAIAFDTVIESFRNDLFDGYKTSAGIEPDLYAQFPLAELAAEALGIVTWRMREFEADDALATFAARAADAPGVERVVIASPDKDLCQCVRGDRVVTLDRIRKTTRDEAAVIAKFGVPPASIPDWLALVGDTADGIPGLPGWGEKSAGKVLARWGHLEAIPATPRAWDCDVRGVDGLGATLRARFTDALLYRRLATLRTDVPLAESLDDLRWRGPRREAVPALADALGDPKLPERLGR